MSDEFDIVFESLSECCGESLHWEWSEVELSFESECACMKRYILRPIAAEVVHDSEEFEADDE